MTSPARIGRNFELEIHKKLKLVFPNDIHVQSWSGTLADPGDIYTKHLLFDCKHISNYSETDIQKWYDKLQREAEVSNRHPVIILRRAGSRSIQIIFNIEHIPGSVISGLARFFWDDGIQILKFMDEYYERKIKNTETTTQDSSIQTPSSS